MIKISDEAKKELQSVLKEQSDKMLRLVIQGVGWGGPRFGLGLDQPNEEEKNTFDGVDFLIDKETKTYLTPLEIKCHKTELNGCGLVITTQHGC